MEGESARGWGCDVLKGTIGKASRTRTCLLPLRCSQPLPVSRGATALGSGRTGPSAASRGRRNHYPINAHLPRPDAMARAQHRRVALDGDRNTRVRAAVFSRLVRRLDGWSGGSTGA